ncbi:MAG: PaaI family thioesterase [Desulfobacterales bacterium]|jgi:uncharacterized protein (TIGR00369 family)|nr:PaaI family thioesterase [Desulfobacterales bacterium]
MERQQLSGLEMVRQHQQGFKTKPTMLETIPMRMTDFEYGSIKFKAFADENHLNSMGGVHGGFAATVLDTVSGGAVQTVLKAGETYTTIDLSVKMLKPVPLNTKLIASGKVIKRSRHLGISESDLKDKQGCIYAHATATCMIMSLEKKAA